MSKNNLVSKDAESDFPTLTVPLALDQIDEDTKAALTLLREMIGDAKPIPEGLDATSVLYPWMVPTILEIPQATVQFLQNLRRIDPEDFRRSAAGLRWKEHEHADRIFSELRRRDPRDVDGNREWLGRALAVIGITGPLVMLAAAGIAVLLLKLGPVGVIAAIIALILGFIVLLSSVVIMIVLVAVNALLGGHGTLASAGTPAPLLASG